jgi:hypothetical protein
MTPTPYIPPSEIDGSPIEVEAAVLAQLTELADEAFVQVRNAWMTRALDLSPSTTPEDLAVEWEESDRRAECERVRILLAEL